MRRFEVLVILLAVVSALASCGRGGADQRTVVVYTALDQQFSEPILKAFEQQTGIRVRPVYDTEAVKTVGLVNRLIAERNRPVCDVFWNNEIVRTIQLQREGLTQPYVSPSAATIPDEFKDPEGHWVGFAARGRVIAVNTQRLPDRATWPTSIHDLTDPRWKGAAGFAKPLFGTTSTHAAILWEQWGEEETMRYWNEALDNAIMYAGNAQARDAAASGEIAWCLTDTDDAWGAMLDGKPVEIIYPDAGEGEIGVVMLPNTVALMRGAPNPEEGRALIDYLLGEEVEAALAQARSAQIPVRAAVPGPEGLPPLAPESIAEVDWQAVADVLPACQQALDRAIGSR